MIEANIKVVNDIPENGKVTRKYDQRIKGLSKLGREIKISPKSNVCVNEKGYQHTFFVESVSVVIGIGKDHTAELVMTLDAWEALKAGEKIDITTAKEFVNKYL